MNTYPPCQGRPLFMHVGGAPMAHSGAYPFVCPACGTSGHASTPREVCGLPRDEDVEWRPVGPARSASLAEAIARTNTAVREMDVALATARGQATAAMRAELTAEVTKLKARAAELSSEAARGALEGLHLDTLDKLKECRAERDAALAIARDLETRLVAVGADA